MERWCAGKRQCAVSARSEPAVGADEVPTDAESSSGTEPTAEAAEEKQKGKQGSVYPSRNRWYGTVLDRLETLEAGKPKSKNTGSCADRDTAAAKLAELVAKEEREFQAGMLRRFAKCVEEQPKLFAGLERAPAPTDAVNGTVYWHVDRNNKYVPFRAIVDIKKERYDRACERCALRAQPPVEGGPARFCKACARGLADADERYAKCVEEQPELFAGLERAPASAADAVRGRVYWHVDKRSKYVPYRAIVANRFRYAHACEKCAQFASTNPAKREEGRRFCIQHGGGKRCVGCDPTPNAEPCPEDVGVQLGKRDVYDGRCAKCFCAAFPNDPRTERARKCIHVREQTVRAFLEKAATTTGRSTSPSVIVSSAA